jgi:hypothetical protein
MLCCIEALERLKKMFEFLTENVWKNCVGRKWMNGKFCSSHLDDFLARLRLIWSIRENHNMLMSLLTVEEQQELSGSKPLQIFAFKKYLETDPQSQKELDVIMMFIIFRLVFLFIRKILSRLKKRRL